MNEEMRDSVALNTAAREGGSQAVGGRLKRGLTLTLPTTYLPINWKGKLIHLSAE